MITTGQTITNRVTGETLVFRTTSADTNGERVVVETFVEPNGAVAAAHVHPGRRSSSRSLQVSSSSGSASRRSSRRPATGSSSRRERLTGSRTSARRRPTSSARSRPRSGSSS